MGMMEGKRCERCDCPLGRRGNRARFCPTCLKEARREKERRYRDRVGGRASVRVYLSPKEYKGLLIAAADRDTTVTGLVRETLRASGLI